MNTRLIQQKVRRLVRFYQSRDPFEIVKGMNVVLVQYPLDGVRGFYQYFQRNNIIYIDERLSEHEKKFVCAHELGHMLLHQKANRIFLDRRTHLNTNQYESEANKFAVELLIPDDFLEENKCFTVEQLSRLTGYHKKLIELRLQR